MSTDESPKSKKKGVTFADPPVTDIQGFVPQSEEPEVPEEKPHSSRPSHPAHSAESKKEELSDDTPSSTNSGKWFWLIVVIGIILVVIIGLMTFGMPTFGSAPQTAKSTPSGKE
jgi:hypothetical protein